MLLVFAAVGLCRSDESKRIDPKPPVLKKVRWQYLDKRYKDVYIDGSGRAWFLIRTFPSSRGGKRPSMFLTCPELPEDYIEMSGYNRPIGFDSQDRFWEVGKYGLCCTNVRTGKFKQRKAAPGVDLSPWRNEDGTSRKLSFTPRMLEHSSGRLYFADSLGIHVLEGDRWNYELLMVPRKGWSAKLAEGPDGMVFAWFQHVQTVFAHDGKSWKEFHAKDHPELDQPETIVPEANGWVRVSRYYGATTRVKLYDATAVKKAVGAATVSPSAGRYDRDFLARSGQELSLFAYWVGRDRHGREYFLTRSHLDSDRYSRVAVMDARYRATEPNLKYQTFSMHRSIGRRALAVDSQGGIWARLAIDEHPFLSRYAGGKWTHYPDPAPVPASQVKGKLALYGETWVIQPPSAGAKWKPDRTKDYRGVPPMANAALLQSLKNGCMIAGEWYQPRVFLFDAQRWHVYESFKALVEARYDWLKANLDNRGMIWKGRRCLGVDAGGRVWLGSPGGYGYSGVYDGVKWQDLPKAPPDLPQGPFEFNASGSRCLRGDSLLDTSLWPPKELASTKLPFPSPRHHLPRGRLRIDKKGQFVMMDPFAAESHKVHASGKYYGFVNWIATMKAGGAWWIGSSGWSGETLFHDLKAVWPDGRRAAYRHRLPMQRHVAHQAPRAPRRGGNVYWVAAVDGLLRLRLTGKGGKSRLVLDKLYPRIMPQGAVTWMAVGTDGALWMATYHGRSGLYRIEIPPLDKQKGLKESPARSGRSGRSEMGTGTSGPPGLRSQSPFSSTCLSAGTPAHYVHSTAQSYNQLLTRPGPKSE